MAAVEAAIPVVLELVVVPVATRGFAEARKRIRSWRQGPADAGAPAAGPSSSELDVAVPVALVEDARVEVNAAEFRERLLRMLIAESIANSEREFLAGAVVRDDDLDPRLGPALDVVLEGEWSALGETEMSLVRAFLEGARTADGQYELLRVERPHLPPPP